MLIKQEIQKQRPRLWGDAESDSCWGVSALGSAVRHCPGIGTRGPPTTSSPKLALTHSEDVSVCQYSPPPPPPLSSLQPPLDGIFRLGQCHFPLCMWIIEIRLSTVIVHCVEPSVIVNQNVLRDFSTQEKRRNKWTTDYRNKTKTRHNMSEHLLYSVYMP